MAEEHALDPTSYIQHHLTFLAEPVRESGGFWTIHYDTIITSVILGVVVFGFLWLITRKATLGRPVENAGLRRAFGAVRQRPGEEPLPPGCPGCRADCASPFSSGCCS